MIRFLIIYALCISTWGYSQSDFLKIEDITEDNSLHHFPIIVSRHPIVSEKINIHLQLSELELIKGFEKKSIFEKTTLNKGTIYGGKVFINYQIIANTDKVLSIKFDESSCGVTCAYWVKYYNFNPQNGDRYAVQDFFNGENYEIFRSIITPIRIENIRQQIHTGQNLDSPLTYLEQYLYPAIEEDDLDDFYISGDTLFFDNENLLHKADKLIEELDQKTAIPLSAFKHLLNDFGQAVFITGRNLQNYRSLTEPQLYEGMIDQRHAIYFLFRPQYDHYHQGIYAYKKYGIGINLEGYSEGHNFQFDEFNDDFEKTAILSFTQEGTRLKGYWSDQKGRQLSFSAQRK